MKATKFIRKTILFLLFFVAAIIYLWAKLPQLDFNNVYDETDL